MSDIDENLQNVLNETRALRDQGLDREALEKLEAYRDNNPPHPWILGNIAQCHRLLGEFENAISAIKSNAELLHLHYDGEQLENQKISKKGELADFLLIFAWSTENPDEKRNLYQEALTLYREINSNRNSKKQTFIKKALANPDYDANFTYDKTQSIGFNIKPKNNHKALSKAEIATIENIEEWITDQLEAFAETHHRNERATLFGNLKTAISFLRGKQRAPEALALTERIIEKTETSDASLHDIAAQCALDTHQFNIALKHYDRGLSLSPDNTNLLLNKAKLLFSFGHITDGKRLVKKAYETKPNYVRAASMYAIGLCLSGKTKETRDVIKPFMKKIHEEGMERFAESSIIVALYIASSDKDPSALTKGFQNKAQSQKILSFVERYKKSKPAKGTRESQSNNEEKYLGALSASGIWENLRGTEQIQASPNPLWNPPEDPYIKSRG